MVKIQSFSDIITNSSSELFVIKGSEESKATLKQFIIDLYDLLKRDIDEDLYIEVADKDCHLTCTKTYDGQTYKLNDEGDSYEYDKGDLLIESTSDNTIPYPIMELIEYYKSVNENFEGEVKRWHLG